MTRVEILATGSELIIKGIRGIEPMMEKIIGGAKNEIQILAYLFTPQARRVLDLIKKAADRGVKITIVINSFETQSTKIKSDLKSMVRKFPHVEIFDFSGQEKRQLHAKIVVVDRKIALVSSANFSWGGMFSNYEIGLLIEDEKIWNLAQTVDILVERSKKMN